MENLNGTKSPPSRTSSVASVAGVKRPAPSLLPAFEPFQSPALPRPSKRIARDSPTRWEQEPQKYPTPIPTSSTGILSSSPPPLPQTRRPGMSRTLSTLSERAPLCAVPTIELDEQGQPILMGRSSNSSHYQLSTNKLISRIHVRATYFAAAEPLAPKRLHVECMGWNGVKVHCQGKAWELRKGDSFTSETEGAEIMVDVQDARVLLQWPRDKTKPVTPIDSDSTWDEHSPQRGRTMPQRSPLQSPLQEPNHLQSPVSPSPAVQAISNPASALLAPDYFDPVQVYEDEDAGQDEQSAGDNIATQLTEPTQLASQPVGGFMNDSQSSVLSDPSHFSDNDEENDPIVHSFGPFGANLDSRMETFTTSTDSPVMRRPALSPLKENSLSPQRPRRTESSKRSQEDDSNPVVNHVINQLAYSRLASTPLSTIMSNLPVYFKDQQSPGHKENKTLTTESLKKMLNVTGCIGEVSREGKDAAGKPLESEFYYVPERDADIDRREAVVEGLRKPGLRACRKQHKVCHDGLYTSNDKIANATSL